MVAGECHKDFFNYCFIKQMKKTFASVTYLKPENKTMKKYVSLEPEKKSLLVYLFKKTVFHLKTKSKFPMTEECQKQSNLSHGQGVPY